TRDESDHRFLAPAFGLVLQELRGVLLGRAADLADHHDRLGPGVGQKHLEDRDEFGALHWVAAYADGSGLAEILATRLKHGFVGEGAGARDDANLAGLEDVAGHNADLAFARGHHARTVGADQPRL